MGPVRKGRCTHGVGWVGPEREKCICHEDKLSNEGKGQWSGMSMWSPLWGSKMSSKATGEA